MRLKSAHFYQVYFQTHDVRMEWGGIGGKNKIDVSTHHAFEQSVVVKCIVLNSHANAKFVWSSF